MPQAARTFVFARVNIIVQLYTQNTPKSELIAAGLLGNRQIERGTAVWTFVNVYKFGSGADEYYYGSLSKVAASKTHPVVKYSSGTTEDIVLNDEQIGRSEFLLNVESGLIAYHFISADIPGHVFRKRFAEVFALNAEAFGLQVEIASIDEQSRMYDELQGLDRVTRISFKLVPSNPHDSSKWIPVDAGLKRLELAQKDEVYIVKNGSSGAVLKADEEIKAKTAMAEDGYGEAAATGYKGSKKVNLSTGQKPVSAKVPPEIMTASAILEHLKSTIDNISSRFRQ